MSIDFTGCDPISWEEVSSHSLFFFVSPNPSSWLMLTPNICQTSDFGSRISSIHLCCDCAFLLPCSDCYSVLVLMVLSNLRTSCVSHHIPSFPSLQLCVVAISTSFAFDMHISVICSLIASFQYSFDLSESLVVYQLQTLIIYCKCWIWPFLWHFLSQWVVSRTFLFWVCMHPFWDVLAW